MTDACQLCAANAGEFRLTCLSCCARLIERAQPGKARKAMAVHIKKSVPAEQWDALLRYTGRDQASTDCK